MEYKTPRQILEKMEVLEEEVQEIRAQSESVRLREEHLQTRYARLQNRYTYLATRMDALEKALEQLKPKPQIEQLTIGLRTTETSEVANSKKDKINDIDHLLSVKEAADMMDVSTKTVMLYLKDGKLEGTKIAGKWKMRPEDVRDCLQTHHIRRRAKKENEEKTDN